MVKQQGVFIFIIFFVFGFSDYVSADSFHAEIFPEEISPGDAFIIKLNGIESSRSLSAIFNKKKLYFSRCGKDCYHAIGAVDLGTEPGVHKIRLKVGKKEIHLELSVRQAYFQTQELTFNEKKVDLSPKNLRRVKRENKMLKAVFKKISRKFWRGDFIFPLENEISTEFGTQRMINQKIMSIHRGIDIRGEEGEEVMASNSGKVVLVRELFFGGKTIILDHGQGIYTIYMHLSEYNVKQYDIVLKGNVIGYVGSTGRSTGSHLHFGVKLLNINVNPFSFIELEL